MLRIHIGWNPNVRGFWFRSFRCWALNTAHVSINKGYFV